MGNSITDISYSSFDANNYGYFVMVGAIALSFPTFADIDYSEDYHPLMYVIAIASDTSSISSWEIKTKRDNSVLTRQEFAKRLLELRKQAIYQGVKLLDADEIITEVKRRRGENIYNG